MIVRWLTAIVLACLLGCDPVDGATRSAASAKVSVDANNHVRGRSRYEHGERRLDRCALLDASCTGRKSRGVSQADARTGVSTLSVPIAETENQRAPGALQVLKAGHSDNFHIVSGGLPISDRHDDCHREPSGQRARPFDDRIVQASPGHIYCPPWRQNETTAA